MLFPFPFRAGHRSQSSQDRGRGLTLETLEPRCAPSGLADSLSPLPHWQLTKLSASKPAEEHLAAPQKSKTVKLAAVKMYVDANGVLSLTAPKSSSSAVALTVSIPQDQVAALKQALSNTRASPATPLPRLVIETNDSVGAIVELYRLDPTTQIATTVSVVANRSTVRSGPPWKTETSMTLQANINQVDVGKNESVMDGYGQSEQGFILQVAADLKSARVKGTVEIYDQLNAQIVPVHIDITLTATSKIVAALDSPFPGEALFQAVRTARVSGSVHFEPGIGLAREMAVPGSTANAQNPPQIAHVVNVYVGPP